MRFTVTGSSEADFLADIVTDEEVKMLLDLHGGLVRKTPVDTGNARAGWSVDTVAMTIENPVDYIDALNNGHSGQAPAGFIENEVDRVSRL